MPLLPANIRVIAAEWRGCGESDKPDPTPDYSNYTMETHARDHLALLDALGIEQMPSSTATRPAASSSRTC
jgi:non-heme chloroperoxidase